MTTSKKQAAIAVAVGVWLVTLGSAAALAYDLTRALHWATRPSQLAASANAASAAEAEPISEAQSALYIPTIPIVGQAPQHHPAVARGTRAP